MNVDMEAGYQSAEFAEYCHSLSYRIETSPTRDSRKANVAMLGNINNPCPQQFWPHAIEFACHSDGFGFKNKIGTSPYLSTVTVSAIVSKPHSHVTVGKPTLLCSATSTTHALNSSGHTQSSMPATVMVSDSRIR